MKDGEPADLSTAKASQAQEDDLSLHACLTTSGPVFLTIIVLPGVSGDTKFRLRIFPFVKLHTPYFDFARSSHPACTLPAASFVRI